MEHERYVRWVNSSHALGRIEPFLIPVIQGLGRLDVSLIIGDKRFAELHEETRNTIEEATNLTDRITYSYLWVLGSYELIRTLDQRCRENPRLLDNHLANKINETKQSFERLRIPLAKLEPSRRHRDTDSPIAYPAIHERMGISWHVSNVFISRRELSDALLALFEEIANTLGAYAA